MKLHSNILTESDIRDALETAKQRGNIDRSVVFDVLERKGSRKRSHGFEVHLEWLGNKVKGDGRRWTNSGNRGADSYGNGRGTYAATYDEWGWLIAELFGKDEHMIFGHYEGMDNFDSRTKFAYVIENPLGV